jgi:DNA-binding MarR family transcriptional regulator
MQGGAPVAELLLFALRRASAKVNQDFQDAIGDDAIRPSAYAALLLLRAHPGIRQSQLSPMLGIRRTNLVPLLAELTTNGLCERKPVEGDRRIAALFLTSAGTAMLQRCETACARHESRMEALLGPGGRDRLLMLLHRLAAPGEAVARLESEG